MKVIGICDDEELAARRLERMIREMLGKRPELYGPSGRSASIFPGRNCWRRPGTAP